MRDLGSLVPLTMLPGTADPSEASAINDNGDVVGTAMAVDAQGILVNRAFLLPANALAMVDLGTLFPDPASPGSFLGESSASSISNSGIIVGDSASPGSLSDMTGAFFVAGNAPTGMFPALMAARHVNDAGLVVGALGTPPNQAFRFSATSGVFDLSNVFQGHTIQKASAINASGQIAAVANDGTNDIALLITP